MHRSERPSPLSPTRRALLGAGVITLALSLALAIAPASAKNANSGTVKIRDASTGQLQPETANDPHVSTFTIVFEYDDPTSGTWQIQSWSPTGDGSVVANGHWTTPAGGSDETDARTARCYLRC